MKNLKKFFFKIHSTYEFRTAIFHIYTSANRSYIKWYNLFQCFIRKLIFYFFKLFFNLIKSKRKWAQLAKDEQVIVDSYSFNPDSQCIAKVIFKVNFMQKNNASPEPFDTDMMAREFTMQFANHAFTIGQKIAFKIENKKLLVCTCHEIESARLDAIKNETSQSTNTKVS